MFGLAEELGVDAVHLFVFVPVGCGLELAEEQRLSPAEFENFMKDYYLDYSRRKVDTRLTCAPQYQRFLAENGEEKPAAATGCLGGRTVCFISFRGDVFPCGYLPVKAGNVREEPLKKIWNDSLIFDRLRDRGNLKGFCGRCDYKTGCGGCRARAFAECGDYLAEDNSCISQGG
jgi:radical SAM protein with 4Fe4S-binding SPASM domain